MHLAQDVADGEVVLQGCVQRNEGRVDHVRSDGRHQRRGNQDPPPRTDIRQLMEHEAPRDDRERHLCSVPHRSQERALVSEFVDVRRADDRDHAGDRRAVEHRHADHDGERERQLHVLPRGDRDQVDRRDAHDEEQRTPSDGGPVDAPCLPREPGGERDDQGDLEPGRVRAAGLVADVRDRIRSVPLRPDVRELHQPAVSGCGIRGWRRGIENTMNHTAPSCTHTSPIEIA